MAHLDSPDRLAAITPSLTRLDDDDEVLDACVAEAARIAEVPIALVSVLMRGIQVFRAQRGLPPELATSRATSRAISFCTVVVQEELPLLVEDAPNDTRVPQVMVENYGIRAYVGVPVRVHGQVVGALCAVDVVPRRFCKDVVVAMKRLASRVSARLAALDAVNRAPGEPIDPEDLDTRARRLVEDARLVECALLAIEPVLAPLAAAPVPCSALSETELRADLRAAIRCYEDMTIAVQNLTAEAARVFADESEPRLARVRLEAQALEREMSEIGPMVLLARGVLTKTLGLEAACKGAKVLVGAFGFHAAALAAARRLIEAAGHAMSEVSS
ncbi:GAF domain-containing protein [Polyangium aurulentum]|uniref:GAF domain-containing protein n=1 Tax=Polyangium aurulentum TaxID=2567896 RepID=UPI0010AE9DA8|nr:GAF domain-containing protein [Polyangium aurulentum]UQA55824.1 GAF domain-containing protein [Polyangium aurulentum]